MKIRFKSIYTGEWTTIDNSCGFSDIKILGYWYSILNSNATIRIINAILYDNDGNVEEAYNAQL